VITRLSCVLGIVLAGVVVWLCDRDSDPTLVNFRRYDIVAHDEARAAKKPIVLYVTSSADPACQEQNRGALRDDRVIAALQPFERFKVDVARVTPVGEHVIASMNIGKVPTFIFTKPNGSETLLVGPQSAEALLAAAGKTLAR
jgi:thiol:disulfide interchange protein